jgi:transposase
MEHCGIDVHVASSEICVLDEGGGVSERAKIPTTQASLGRWFGGRERMRICIEAGGMSPWVSRVLGGLGHEVIVGNPQRIRLIAEARLKFDGIDAEVLARLVRSDIDLVRPTWQRSEETQRLRAVLRARRVLVTSRTACLNATRGVLRSFGFRVPKGTAERMARIVADVPEALAGVVAPLIATALELDERIGQLDEEVKALGEARSEVALLQSVPGVGPVVALSYALCIENPDRFRKSRDVAGFLGLRPTVRASGERSRHGGITHQGDTEMRMLLVQAAHCLLRTRADSDLKRWGEQLEHRIGKQKAVVAVARKLAVVMHRMWVNGESFRSTHEVDKAA